MDDADDGYDGASPPPAKRRQLDVFKAKKKDPSNCQIPTTSLSKLGVIHSHSRHVPNNIEFDKDSSIIVRFTNFTVSAPIVANSGIDKHLTPCPPVDSSDTAKCDHEYTAEERQTRKGDEITTVIYICVKCSHRKIQ